MPTLAGTWREPHRDIQVPRSEALQAWTASAVPLLEMVASKYGDYITYKNLARELSDATGFHTAQPLHYWVGDVLGSVITECEQKGLPALSSLVVHTSDGMVGSGFNEVLRRSGRDTFDDPYDLEMAAAEERLNCYRLYCPDLPADAKPQLTREYSARVQRKEQTPPKPKPVCPVHGIQLPATGICDDCG